MLSLTVVRLASFLVPRGVRAEWRQEWEAEIGWRADKLRAWGRWSPAGRLQLTIRSLGSIADAAWLRMEDLRQGIFADLRLGARLLRKHAALSAVSVTALAAGIALNTSLFAVVDGLLWQNPPVRDPGRFAALYTSDSSGPLFGNSSLPDFHDLVTGAQSWEYLAAFQTIAQAVEANGEIERLEVTSFTGPYFEATGIAAHAGRLPAAGSEVLIGYSFWQRRFGGAPSAIGAGISFAGRGFTISGIAPSGFTGVSLEEQPQVWLPMTIPENAFRGNRRYDIIGLRKPGVTLAAAQSELSVIAARLYTAHPAEWRDRFGKGRSLTAVPAREARFDPAARSNVTGISLFALALAAIVQLLLCANVAGVLLARAQTRRKEIAVRLALGAARFRLVRQLIAESALLGLLGGALGILLAWWALPVLRTAPAWFGGPEVVSIAIHGRAIAFALGLVLITSAIAGVLPALGVFGPDLMASLKDDYSGRGFRSARSRWGGSLVAAQFAASLVLLVVAALLGRSLLRMQNVEPGFHPGNQTVARVEVALPHRQPENWKRWAGPNLERLRALPGVENAAIAWRIPLAQAFPRRSYAVEGHRYGPQEERQIFLQAATAGYLATMGIPLRLGRDFDPAEVERGAGGLLVNEAFARHYWPGQDPIGKRLEGPPGQFRPVIGVFGNWKFRALTQGDLPMVIAPLEHNPTADVTVHIRGPNLPRREDLAAALHNARIFSTVDFHQVMRDALRPARLSTIALLAFSGLALALSAIGVFGVVAQTVAQSRREIAVRAALGATRSDVLRAVLGGGIRLLAAGLVIGLPASYGAARLLEGWLFGVRALDPPSIAAAAAVLILVGLAAMWLPARRAAAVDPAAVLRYQ
ncbi:MAG: ADOP family duplicated permease [Bryobacteraceae bacterium]|nr:ADOP family duplicated permease [Bryobacteraceae bacterium]